MYCGRLLMMLRPYWRPTMAGMLMGSLIGIIGMVSPYFSKLLIDDVYPAHNVSLMHVIVFGGLALSLATVVMGLIQGYYTLTVNAQLATSASLMFYNHVQHLTVPFWDRHRTGEVMSRSQDLYSAIGFVTSTVQTFVTSGINLVLVPPILLLINWRLALLSLVATPLTSGIGIIASRLLRRYWQASAEAHAELSAFQFEALSHIRTVKAIAGESFVCRESRRQLERALRLQLTAGGLGNLTGAVTGTIHTVAAAAVMFYAWTLILNGDLTLGGYIAFSAYVGYMHKPIGSMVGLFNGFQQAAVSLGRTFEYLDAPVEQDPGQAFLPLRPIERVIDGTIELRGVTVRYANAEPALTEIDLRAEPGQRLAIIGQSGAGKSSLLKALSRMVDPEAGTILIDGEPIARYTLADLRRQIGVVSQEVALLRGSIWENLTLALEDVPESVVDDAVRVCRLRELITALPDGYATPVSEWGASLSGGQRQRIAIARALIRDTPILLLDEATSQIDVQTEDEILRDLFARTSHRTVIMVTHRIATAMMADHICMLDRGRIVALGSHDELFAANASYRRMLDMAATGEDRRLRLLQPSGS